MTEIVKQLYETGAFRDPASPQLIETRKAVIKHWMTIADMLHAQGATTLTGDVRHFAQHMPPLLTNKEMLGTRFAEHHQARRQAIAMRTDKSHERTR